MVYPLVMMTKNLDAHIEYLCETALPTAVDAHYPDLVEQLAPSLAEGTITNAVEPSMLDWRNGRLDNLADLESHVKQRLTKWLKSDEVRDMIFGTSRKWFANVVRETAAKSKLGKDYKEELPEFLYEDGMFLEEASSLNIHIPEVSLVNGASASVVTVLMSVIIAVLAGTSGALITTGPIGILVALIVGFTAMGYGTHKASEKIRYSRIPLFLRQLLLSDEKLKDLLLQSREKIESSIRQSLLDQEPTVLRLLQTLIRHALRERMSRLR